MYFEASKPKWVNAKLNIIGVNSLRLGGLHIYTQKIGKLKLLKLNDKIDNKTKMKKSILINNKIKIK